MGKFTNKTVVFKKRIKEFFQGMIIFLTTGFYLSEGRAAEHIVQLEANPYSLKETANNHVDVTMEGFNQISKPGYPSLPLKIFTIALPQSSRIIDVFIETVLPEKIPGQYMIQPVPPRIPSIDYKTAIEKFIEEYQSNMNFISGLNSYYPESSVEYNGTHYYYNIPLVQIRYTPIQIHPTDHELQIIQSAVIRIDYVKENNDSEITHYETIHYTEKLFWIDEDLSSPGVLPDLDPLELENTARMALLIIGSQAIQSAIEDFIFWKSCIQISTRFESTEWIYSEMTGKDHAEKIRNFLKEKVIEWGINHVLLIGDTDLIPMEKFYPDPGNHKTGGEVPSDNYYAELTGEWDGDSDGFPGEFSEDHVEFTPEIKIGRIPYNSHDDIINNLEKVIDYEKNNWEWKADALMIGGMINYQHENHQNSYYYQTDGAVLMEFLKNQIFQPEKSTTLYEKEGLNPSQYLCDFSLSNNNVQTLWQSEIFGCVTWWSHGSYRTLNRKWWAYDDGDETPEAFEMYWEKIISLSDMPSNLYGQSIIFANACDNGWPERSSLGRELLKNNALEIILPSRLSWSVLGWNHIEDGGNATLTYHFWEAFILKDQSIGESFHHAKVDYIKKFSESWYDLYNFYTYNLYGDPTLHLNQEFPVYGALKVVITVDDNNQFPDQGVQIKLLNTVFDTTLYSVGDIQSPLIPSGLYNLQCQTEGEIIFEKEVEIKPGEITNLSVMLPLAKNPKLVLSDTSYTTVLLESNIKQKELVIYNQGNMDLEYQLITDSSNSWIDFNQTMGSVGSGGEDHIQLILNTENMDQNHYHSLFQIVTNDPNYLCVNFPVTLDVIDTVPPAPISDLALTKVTMDSLVLHWTAPGDNGISGCAEMYEIWMAPQPLKPDDFKDGILLSDSLIPGFPGVEESYVVKLELPYDKLWFLIVCADEVGWSASSNVVSIDLRGQFSPYMVFSDSSVTFTLQEGYAKSSDVQISNQGGGELEYKVIYDESLIFWFSVESTGEKIGIGETKNLTVKVDAENLDSGIYESQFSIRTNEWDDSLKSFPVILSVIDTIPPGPIHDLKVEIIDEDTVAFFWTAPGDNGLIGIAERYEIWTSEQQVIDRYIDNGFLLCDSLCPDSVGKIQYIAVDLDWLTTDQWIFIKTWDEVGLYSYSNMVLWLSYDVNNIQEKIPSDYILQNFPNPFNSSTRINFSLSELSEVTILIFNNVGQMVKKLVTQQMGQGSHSVFWNGKDDNNFSVPSGIYFYQIVTSKQQIMKKMLLIK